MFSGGIYKQHWAVMVRDSKSSSPQPTMVFARKKNNDPFKQRCPQRRFEYGSAFATYLYNMWVCICQNCLLDTKIFFFIQCDHHRKMRFSTMY